MSLQSPEDFQRVDDEIMALRSERGCDYADASRLHWFGYRAGDGRTVNPLVLQHGKTSLQIMEELRVEARAACRLADERRAA